MEHEAPGLRLVTAGLNAKKLGWLFWRAAKGQRAIHGTSYSMTASKLGLVCGVWWLLTLCRDRNLFVPYVPSRAREE
jgi:hypothetical protein